jgi:hypothetical protein
MDYFYVGNGHNTVGLSNPFLKSSFKLNETSNLIAHLHYFQSAVDLLNTDGSSAEAYLGTELDLVYNLQVAEAINLKIGLSALKGSSSMELIKAGSADNMNVWAWSMLTFKPVLFKTELSQIENEID